MFRGILQRRTDPSIAMAFILIQLQQPLFILLMNQEVISVDIPSPEKRFHIFRACINNMSLSLGFCFSFSHFQHVHFVHYLN